MLVKIKQNTVDQGSKNLHQEQQGKQLQSCSTFIFQILEPVTIEAKIKIDDGCQIFDFVLKKIVTVPQILTKILRSVDPWTKKRSSS